MEFAMKRTLLLTSLIFFLQSIAFNLYSQDLTQTVRGSIKDKDSRISLIGATVAIYKDSTLLMGAATDVDGYFKIENVPIGRYTVIASFLGYSQIVLPNIIVNSGKEVLLPLAMEESIMKMEEIQITAARNRGEAMNEMATVSARTFSVEETERYAGSRGDPARMASNFAGCQGADDSRNDIVVRGNSPLGILYRVEGVDIPNPNHFAVSGSSGGPISILNNKVLGTSDFFTGAFPAEFGNSTAGVFDIKMRNGNNEKFEFTGQLGLFGTELTAEGPISRKKRSSFIVNYRYSTLVFFGFLGVNLGTTATPYYQDASFKLNFPLKKGGNISFFGLGGASSIDILISEQKPDEVEIYGDTDRDQFFKTKMGVVGANYSKSLNASTFTKFTIATSVEIQNSYHQLLYQQTDMSGAFVLDADGLIVIDSLVDKLRYNFQIGKTSANYYINKKFGARHVVKAGFTSDYYRFNMIDSVYNDGTTYDWSVRWDHKGDAVLFQPYLLWKFRISEKLVLNTGLHSQYFSLNNSFSAIEPRAGFRYDLNEKNTINVGLGLHSQLQPMYTYFYHISDGGGGYIQHNKGMDFTKSVHYVLGHDYRLGRNMRIKTEAYYQQLYNIPVTVQPSSFSLVNQGSGFSRFFPDSLENKGTGENYGLEVTVEKFFSKKFFFMLTVSLFESFYKGSDGVKRDTDFNGNYATNLLASREFQWGGNKSFSVGAKITAAGNKRYGPVDTTATVAQGEIVYEDATRNSLQLKPYFRADLKLNYKVNQKKVTHEIGIDIVNLLNTKNILKLTYAPDPSDPSAPAIREEYQLGLLPIFYYKLDF